MEGPVREVLEEIGQAVSAVDEAAVAKLCEAITSAGRIATYACGREGLQVKGFAMRLFHLGLPVAVVGDMTTPALGKGDLLLVSSGPGEISTVMALMGVAKKDGARVFALTAQPISSVGRMADDVLVIPAQTMASDQGQARTSVLPMGSVFEGALFVLFELAILRLKDRIKASPEAMRARHTNLE